MNSSENSRYYQGPRPDYSFMTRDSQSNFKSYALNSESVVKMVEHMPKEKLVPSSLRGFDGVENPYRLPPHRRVAHHNPLNPNYPTLEDGTGILDQKDPNESTKKFLKCTKLGLSPNDERRVNEAHQNFEESKKQQHPLNMDSLMDRSDRIDQTSNSRQQSHNEENKKQRIQYVFDPEIMQPILKYKILDGIGVRGILGAVALKDPNQSTQNEGDNEILEYSMKSGYNLGQTHKSFSNTLRSQSFFHKGIHTQVNPLIPGRGIDPQYNNLSNATTEQREAIKNNRHRPPSPDTPPTQKRQQQQQQQQGNKEQGNKEQGKQDNEDKGDLNVIIREEKKRNLEQSGIVVIAPSTSFWDTQYTGVKRVELPPFIRYNKPSIPIGGKLGGEKLFSNQSEQSQRESDTPLLSTTKEMMLQGTRSLSYPSLTQGATVEQTQQGQNALIGKKAWSEPEQTGQFTTTTQLAHPSPQVYNKMKEQGYVYNPLEELQKIEGQQQQQQDQQQQDYNERTGSNQFKFSTKKISPFQLPPVTDLFRYEQDFNPRIFEAGGSEKREPHKPNALRYQRRNQLDRADMQYWMQDRWNRRRQGENEVGDFKSTTTAQLRESTRRARSKSPPDFSTSTGSATQPISSYYPYGSTPIRPKDYMTNPADPQYPQLDEILKQELIPGHHQRVNLPRLPPFVQNPTQMYSKSGIYGYSGEFADEIDEKKGGARYFTQHIGK